METTAKENCYSAVKHISICEIKIYDIYMDITYTVQHQLHVYED